MKPRSLLIQGSIALAMLVLINVSIQWLSANSVPLQLLQKCAQAEPATDLFLGNSTMAAGLDEAAFAATGPGRHPLNAAMGATSPVEHYVIYSQQSRHNGAAVYYGFLDTQLTDVPQGDLATLVGNRAMAYYVDPALAFSFYAAGDPAKSFYLGVLSHVPVVVHRYAIWAKVERLRRVLAELGLPRKENNRFGRAEDFALLEPESVNEFADRCTKSVAERAPLNAPVAALIQRARAQGAPVYMVEMPMPKSHRERFYWTPQWIKYREYLKALLAQEGAIYVAGADWVGDNGFADALHLNPLGAKVFSERLGQKVAEME